MTTSATTATTATAPTAVFNPFNWLVRLEAAFRQAEQLKSTEDHHLRDMGITRKQADAVFYGRFGQHRYYSR
ncbi:MAG: hypothetical protein ACU0C9_14180 [Paracoccaceae bacterium]